MMRYALRRALSKGGLFTSSARECHDNKGPKNDWWYSEERLRRGIAIGFSGAVAVALAVIPLYSSVMEMRRDAGSLLSGLLSSGIKKSRLVFKSKRYVRRGPAEDKLLSFLSKAPEGTYVVVYGAKGAGKSDLTDHVLSGQEGVVKLTVTSADSIDNIVAELAVKVVGNKASSGIKSEDFLRAVEQCEKFPAIVFDVERGGSLDQASGIHAVRSLSKLLAKNCRCIIVLSEANAVLEFGKDSNREVYHYVDEMSKTEASELLGLLNKPFTLDEQNYIFDTIGTSPAMLINLAGKVPDFMTLKEFVDDYISSARLNLLAFPHQQILQALKLFPDGVSPNYFVKQENKGVDLSDPEAVGVAMKRSNAIVYRIDLKVYSLMSTAHRTALKTYDPILKRWYEFYK